MITVEPRIYRLKLHLDSPKAWGMEQLCKDLCVKAEQGEPIQEDQWGTRGVLELWLQEIENDYIVLHIQKKHSSHKKRYLQDLELLLSDLDNIRYIANYQEIHYSGHLCR